MPQLLPMQAQAYPVPARLMARRKRASSETSTMASKLGLTTPRTIRPCNTPALMTKHLHHLLTTTRVCHRNIQLSANQMVWTLPCIYQALGPDINLCRLPQGITSRYRRSTPSPPAQRRMACTMCSHIRVSCSTCHTSITNSNNRRQLWGSTLRQCHHQHLAAMLNFLDLSHRPPISSGLRLHSSIRIRSSSSFILRKTLHRTQCLLCLQCRINMGNSPVHRTCPAQGTRTPFQEVTIDNKLLIRKPDHSSPAQTHSLPSLATCLKTQPSMSRSPAYRGLRPAWLIMGRQMHLCIYLACHSSAHLFLPRIQSPCRHGSRRSGRMRTRLLARAPWQNGAHQRTCRRSHHPRIHPACLPRCLKVSQRLQVYQK